MKPLYKLFVLLLALFINTTVFSINIPLEFEGGDGTSDNPYQVSSAYQLNNVRNYLSSYFIQTADIDLSTACADGGDYWNDGAGWLPIGNEANNFTGNYNGNNCTINGVYINRPTTNYVGLYGYTDRAEFKNIVLENISITGYIHVGGLVGYTANSTTITNVYNSGNISGYSCVGGLVGYNGRATISHSCNSANINGIYNIGGLVGWNSYSNSISNCYNTGSINGTSGIGGLAGYNSSTILNCYSSGSVSGTLNVGGLVGYSSNSSITNSFYDKELALQRDTLKGDPKATYEMLLQTTFTDWDFEETWAIDEGNSRPYFIGQDIAIYNEAISNLHVTSLTLGKGKIGNTSDSDINITEYGYMYKRDTPPTLDDCEKTATVTGYGNLSAGNVLLIPETDLVDLDTDSTYFFVSYATDGTQVWYGDKSRVLVVEPDFAGGFGSIEEPYQVSTPFHLNNVRNYSSAYFIQMADIDLTAACAEGGDYWNEGAGWEPIGTEDEETQVHYNGNNHTITGLYINRPTTDNNGLFAYLKRSTIKNLGLSNVNITGNNYNGSLLGYDYGSTITNVYATGFIKGTNGTGGIISKSSNSNTSMTNCYSTIFVNNGLGLTATSYVNANNSYYDKNTSGTRYSGAGEYKITAEMLQDSTFTDWDFTTTWAINNGHSRPYLKGQSIAIYNEGITDLHLTSFSLGKGKILNTSDANITITEYGYMYKRDTPPTLDDCTKIATVTDPTTLSPGDFLSIPETNLTNLDTDSTYYAVSYATDGNNVWYGDGTGVCVIEPLFAGGIGTVDEPYQVSTPFHLNNVRDYSWANFIQTADIDMSEACAEGGDYWNDGAGWEPIGDPSTYYKTKYNGQGYTIQGLYINRPTTINVGLFGYVYYAELKNIALENVNITGNSYTGALVGHNRGTTISNSYSSGSVNGTSTTGGLVGYNYSSSTIQNCYASGSVYGTSSTGGLVGYNNNSSTIQNCYSSVSVNGTSSAGGLVGNNYSSTVSNSFYDKEISTLKDTDKGTPLSTTQMLQQASFSDWDFTDVWGINEGNSQPYLKNQNIAIYNETISNLHINSLTLGKGKIVNTSDTLINITEYGYMYKRSSPPTLDDCEKVATVSNSGNLSPGSVLSIPATHLENLTTDSVYYSVAYATDGDAIWLGNEIRTLVIEPEFADGDGSFDDPYQIATPFHLNSVRNYINDYKYFIQIADIDLTAACAEGGDYWNDGEGWEPLGESDYSERFRGYYDGQGYRIIGLYINRPTSNNVGLWGYTYGGKIEDLGLVHVNITGNNNTGGLVGYNERNAITNSYSTGSINGNEIVGGLVGLAYSSTSISNCYSSVSVEGTKMVGNLVGYVYNNASVSNCYSSGNVIGTYYIGGLVGLKDASATISNSFYDKEMAQLRDTEKGEPKSTLEMLQSSTFTNWDFSDVWGINEGNSRPYFNYQDIVIFNEGISNLHTTSLTLGEGKVVNTSDTAITITEYGYMYKRDTAVTFDNGVKVSTVTESKILSSGDSLIIDGADLTELDTDSTYFVVTYATNGTKTWYGDEIRISVIEPDFAGGFGSLEEPYQIANSFHLNNVRNYLDKNFIQTADIDLTADCSEGGDYWDEGAGWSPIGIGGIYSSSFEGTYDGQEHIIKGLFINRLWNYVGLFGGSGEGEIKNLGIINANILGKNSVGTLIGYGEKVTVTNCYSTGIVEGQTQVGGLIGQTYNQSNISNCYSSASVVGIDESHYCGGLIGQHRYNSVLSNSYSNGSVNGSSYAGGLVGYNDASITNCYSTGKVEGESYFGGLVGRNNSESRSFYDEDITELEASSGNVPKSTSNMLQLSTFSGWDFETIWDISEGNSRPYLQYQDVAVYNEAISNLHLTSLTLGKGKILNTSDTIIAMTEYGYMYQQGTPPTIDDCEKIATITSVVSLDPGDTLSIPATDLENLTTDSTYYARVYATNGIQTWYGDEIAVIVLEPICTSTLSTLTASEITTTTATSGGDITNIGNPLPTNHGICWNTSENPTIYGDHTSLGAISTTGTFSSEMTGLTIGETYYVRAYTINTEGTAYGEQTSFTTQHPPIVTTEAASEIALNSAIANGTISDLGLPYLTQHGLCWSTSENPTLDDEYTSKGAASTLDTFTSAMTSLVSGVTYHVRAYATNSIGTTYGDDISFTTYYEPTVTTQDVSSISTTSATGNGNITNLGIPNPTQYGVCWSTNDSPTIADEHTTEGQKSQTGAFTSDITGLTPATTYHVVAYASNEVETVYGASVSFTTKTTPSIQASNVHFSDATSSSMHVSWDRGNGAYCIVFMKEDIGDTCTPNDYTTYSANPIFTSGTQVTNTDWYCVYKGTDNKVDIIGISGETTYQIFVCEYNGLQGSELYNSNAGVDNPESILTPKDPVLTTQKVSDITTNSAIGYGDITDLGNPTPTAYGFCWSTEELPTLTDNVASNGAISTTGIFTDSLTALYPGTTYYLRAYATNTASTAYGSQISFTTVSELATITTQAVTDSTTTTATGHGNITYLGGPFPTAYGVCWNTTGTPTTSDNSIDNGAASVAGAFNASITGLSPNTTYFVRAYAINAAGTSYGSEISFSSAPQAATVSTQAVTDISKTSATGHGNITDLGIPDPTAHGICWNKTGYPTVLDSIADNEAPSATGDFSAEMSALEPGTRYYVRAYATNTAGPAYGEQVYFTTSPDIPTVTSTTTNIAVTSATLGGNVTDANGASVTERGIVYNTTGSPTIADTKISISSGTGTFSQLVSDLTSETTYYFRAYAINSVGLAYGETITITTLEPEFEGGEGTLASPYQVKTAYHLNNVRKYPTSYFIQIADIDLTTACAEGGDYWNKGAGWEPIGNNSTKFQGKYNGNNYTIQGLFINRPTMPYVGLYGYTNRSEITNLALENVNISGGLYTGGLVGYNYYYSTISNCSISGNVNGTSNYVGGLVGYNYNYSTISNCSNSGNVNGTSYYTAGLVGYNYRSTINTCYNSGNVNGGSNYIGGLVGYNDRYSYISNAYNSGSISGISNVGGLVGYNYYSTSISNCYGSGSVSGTSNVGGLVGYNYQSSTVSNSFYDQEISGQSDTGKGEPKTTEEMLQQATFSSWDFSTVWGISESNSRPYLLTQDIAIYNEDISNLHATSLTLGKGKIFNASDSEITITEYGYMYKKEAAPSFYDCEKIATVVGSVNLSSGDTLLIPVTDIEDLETDSTYYFVSYATDGTTVWYGDGVVVLVVEPKFAGGEGTLDDPYQVANAFHLNNVRDYPTSYFIQIADINLTSDCAESGDYWNDGAGWEPIGNNNSRFQGTYNGNNYTIQGLFINRPTMPYVGLYGYTNRSKIKDLTLENVSITGYSYTGGLVGYNYNYSTISNCFISGNVNGTSIFTGGLVGYNKNYSTINNCFNSGNVNGDSDYVGGLVGYNYRSTVDTCYNSGNINGASNYVGGLIGQNHYHSSIKNCYSSGSVSGTSNTGGLIGYISYYSSISNCYSSGSVNATSNVGGLVGLNSSSSVSNSYYDKETSGQSDTEKGEPKTTKEMLQQATFSSWDFSTVWGISENNSRPYLLAQDIAIYNEGNSNLHATSLTLGKGKIFNASDSEITITEYGYMYKKEAAPSFYDCEKIATIVGSINLSSEDTLLIPITDIENLETDSTYYFVSYATDGTTVWYGDGVAVLVVEPKFAGGDGTLDDPYQVANAYHLNNVRDYLTSYFMQIADIDLTSDCAEGGDYWNDGAGWKPIGDNSYNFQGTYNGNNHSIQGLFINRPTASYVGLYGYTNGSEITNLALENVSITGYSYTGGLVGYNYNYSTISNCSISGNVNGISYYTGGLVGYNNYFSTISNCSNSGNTNGDLDYVGGLVGYNYRSTVDTCYNSGNINGASNYVGGLIGQNYYYSSIKNCYSSGSISGTSNTGGLIGNNNYYSSISNCYSSGSVNGTSNTGGLVGYNYYHSSISNCYSSGSVSGTSNVGGLVGYNYTYSTVNNSYYDKETSEQEDTEKGEAKTTEEMLQQATFSSWDFSTVWGISADNSRPYLSAQNIAIYNEGISNLHATSLTLGKGKIFNASDSEITITEYGYMYKKEAAPSFYDCEKIATVVSSINLSSEDTLLIPITDIEDLETDSTYYFVSYATDGNTVWYGDGVAAILADPIGQATVSTLGVEEKGLTTATINASITYLGNPNPTQYGVCWSTSENPTLSDSKTQEGAALTTGTFSSDMTGLTSGITYYVRAYATNTEGTAYGDTISFRTKVEFTINVISNANINENVAFTSVTPSITGTPIGNVTYTLGGTDAAFFTIDTISGVVSMEAKDYENPEDDNRDNTYEISITAIDTDGNSDTEDWAVTVDNVNDDVATSLSENSENPITVYPNPFINEIFINDTDSNIKTITITTLSGKIIHASIPFGKGEIHLDHLTPGMYILILEKENNEKEVIKIIKK